MVVIVDQALDHIIKMILGIETAYTGFRWYWTGTDATAETGSETDLLAPSVVYRKDALPAEIVDEPKQYEGDWDRPFNSTMAVSYSSGAYVVSWWEKWFAYATYRPYNIVYEIGWYFGNGDTRLLSVRHVIPEGLNLGDPVGGGGTPEPEITLELTIEAA
jgi:hypothetical protein